MTPEDEVAARVEAGESRLVWQQGWSMACCGTSFAVGDQVTWRLTSTTLGEWLARVWGPAAGLVAAEDARHEGPGEPFTVSVWVRTIWAAYCFYTADTDDSTTLLAVDGSGVLHRAVTATTWPVDVPGMKFAGYLVEIEARQPR